MTEKLTDARVQEMSTSLNQPNLGMIVLQGGDLNDLRAALGELSVIRDLVRELNIDNVELLRLRNECEVKSDKQVKVWGKFLQKLVDHARKVRAAA